MRKVAVLFPSDDPSAGMVSAEFERERRICAHQRLFEVALYNEDAFREGAQLEVVPAASEKSVFCLLRGRSMSLSMYERLCRDLRHFGYKPMR